ncbi:amino acid ABC transporter permease [Vineibacter terrae]|uniref:amino acid ABC transporter permease n=1 Tax=Vineibacter terrae TaxID=2586908 RepID=UPI002E3055E0|nr:amino acid ABC transporter permease [Vineibacter terrae]HEX2888226.1 amino acid ABC transporter permease [Vineibacter terrae]
MSQATEAGPATARPARLPPATEQGALGWLRKNLFSSWGNTITTLVIVALMAWFAVWFVDWAVLNAVFTAESGQECVGKHGACWAIIGAKFRYIFFGSFPYEQHWRPLFAILTMLAMLVLSCDRRMWSAGRLAIIWGVGSVITFLLMLGEIHIPVTLIFVVALIAGLAGYTYRRRVAENAERLAYIALAAIGGLYLILRILGVVPAVAIPIALFSYVETGSWGGLAVTMILATYGLAFAFPYGILLALGRRSNLPLIRGLCIGFIELIRGVPLISLLIMASVMLPLFLPSGTSIDKFLRAQVAVILFAGAYIAEIVRGGLQALPKGQFEAADAMGLNYVQRTALIVLPQALRVVIPPLINTFIGFFKDTSLVLIIGIFDFLKTASQALVDPLWTGFPGEIYLFAAAVYFCFCFSMSRYSKYLERELNKGTQR